MRRMLVAVLFGSTALVPATALAQQADQQQAQDQCQELVSFAEQHRQAEDQMGLTLDQAEQIAERGSEVACATALTTAQANLRPELERAQMEERDQQLTQEQQQDQQLTDERRDQQLTEEQREQQLTEQQQDQQLTEEQRDQQAQRGDAQEGRMMMLRSQERQQMGEARQDPQAEEMQPQELGQAAQPEQQDATLQAQQRLERAQQQLRQAMDQQAAAQQELEQALHDLRMATGQDRQQVGQQAQQQQQQEVQQPQQAQQQQQQEAQQQQQQEVQQPQQQDRQAQQFGQQEQTERQALQMDQQQLAEQETGLQGLDIPVEELRGAQVIGAEGEEIGEVQRVMDHDGEIYVIVAAGGFLGLGERDVALPLSDMQYRDGQLHMPNLTEEQVQGMQEADIADFREVGEGQGQTQAGGQQAQ